MIEFDFIPRGICARSIHVTLSDDGKTVKGASFVGGCNGNLKAIGQLVKDRSVDEVYSLLKGNTCGPKPTSCADQMCIALREAQKLATE